MQILAPLKDFQKKIPARLTFWSLFLVVAVATGYDDVTHYQDLSTIRFIGHADQANVAMLARNIAEGNGAVVDAIWLHTNGGIEGNEIPLPEPYWSIYVAAIIAVFFYFLSPGLTALLIPAVLTKTAIAALAAHITFKLSKQHITAFAVAVVLLCDAHMEIAVSGLSDIYLALFMLLTCTTLCYAITRDSPLLFFVVGVLIGIAIGVKPSGMLLIGLLLGYLLFLGNVRKAIRNLALSAVGILIGVGPLAYHNYQAFGSVYSPAFALVREADRIRFVTDNHNRAFYDPEPYTYTAAELELLTGPANELSRARAFFRALITGRIFPVGLLILAAVSVLWVLSQVRSFFIYRKIEYEKLFEYVAVQMLIAGVVLGFAVHTEPRYWLFMVPFLSIGAIYLISRFSQLMTLGVVFLILYGALTPTTTVRSAPLPPWFTTADEVLPQDATVLTSNPWQFAYHTRRKTVSLPIPISPRCCWK